MGIVKGILKLYDRVLPNTRMWMLNKIYARPKVANGLRTIVGKNRISNRPELLDIGFCKAVGNDGKRMGIFLCEKTYCFIANNNISAFVGGNKGKIMTYLRNVYFQKLNNQGVYVLTRAEELSCRAANIYELLSEGFNENSH